MIYDTLDRLEEYADIVPFVKEVASELREKDFKSLDGGEYRTKEHGILIQVQDYETNPNPLFEVHDKFIDIHTVLIGEEYYDGARILESLPKSFDEEKDIGFFDSEVEVRSKLTPGVFAISFPYEPHRPRVSVDGKRRKGKKIVVKIPYSK